MKITPMDISNKEFKKVIRGYSSEEVDEFLDNIAEDYEALYKENSSLKEKMLGLNEKIEHYAKMETTIQNTLLLAQNAAEQSKQTAQKEADIIIRSANETSQRILDKAHNDVLKVNDDYEGIKQEFIKFRTKFKNFMNTQIEMFESLEKDVVKNYSIGSASEDYIVEKEIQTESILENDNDDFRVKNIEDNDFKDDNLNEIKSFFVKSE
ncbi:DivIVA domain-containing protein [Candidatus Clostridium radicumherbarum]|uniref:DivIVA domain-containing protein n=1 Tax=Candidatus Clostridium radicumherbarum TaxID=3381662 RepID=A0ABW8TVU3_9CLOT